MVRASTAVPTTPLQIQTRRQKLITSPPTPHRIELRTDSNEESNCKKPFVLSQPPAPKTRKKLTNNQVLNGTHQNGEVKNHETKECAKNNLNYNKHNGQLKLTEYFPVRRSVRKTKTTVLEEKQLALEQLVRKEVEEGLEVRCFDGKGRGVVTTKDFHKGDFVVEYSGELIDILDAKEREETYAQNETAGCYMYYFKHNGIQYCIDATEETGRLGRLVNHSRNNSNLMTKTIMVDKKPRLVLIAKEDIRKGEEQDGGAPPHFGQQVRAYLDETFPRRWIGRIEWPARFPDTTPPDYLLCGHVKKQVCANRPQDIEETKFPVFLLKHLARSLLPRS